MHWIYILRCSGDTIYVGETERLYRRLSEHKNGRGSKTTKDFKPYMLMGVYKLIKDGLTFKDSYAKDMYDSGEITENKLWALELENQITLMYMKAMNTRWDDVYGGKYHVGYRPSEIPVKNCYTFRPYCKCKIPADIHQYKDDKYWRCCRKNIWDGLNEKTKDLKFLEVDCCDYYKKYNKNDKYICESFIYSEPEKAGFKCSKCEKTSSDITLFLGKLTCKNCL